VANQPGQLTFKTVVKEVTYRAKVPPSATSLFFDEFHRTGTLIYGALDELILAHTYIYIYLRKVRGLCKSKFNITGPSMELGEGDSSCN